MKELLKESRVIVGFTWDVMQLLSRTRAWKTIIYLDITWKCLGILLKT